jgi:hypothetical protein
LIVDVKTLKILATAQGKGKMHDFRVYKQSETRCHRDLEMLADGGYQGLKKLHSKSQTPHKRWRGQTLSQEQQQENQALASTRIVVEHVIRCMKIFRVLKEVYRHRRKRFGLRFNLIAGLYNADLALKS